MPKMMLSELSFCFESLDDNNNISICGLSYDSRRCKRGELFFCKGRAFKVEYAVKAYQKGACAIVCERGYFQKISRLLPNAVIILTDDITACMAKCAAHFYGYPMRRLISVAVTGTKGKSTTVHYINSILNANGFKSTELSSMIDKGAPRLTTPEAIDLHKAAYKAIVSGFSHIVCEISSQAQKEKRTYGIIFDCACFLNLGRDHIGALEHTDEEEYYECKRTLFDFCRTAIINTDDRCGKRLYHSLPKNLNKLTFSASGNNADYYTENIQTDGCGCDLSVFCKETGKEFPLFICGIGEHNIQNALCACTTALLLGASKRAVFSGIAAGTPKGRGSVFTSADGKITIIVDYAHNEMSFEAMFKIAETRFAGAIVTAIFGCPGDKAQCRRYQLAKVCADNADKVIICEDDSAYEGYDRISAELRQHFSNINGKRLNKLAVAFIEKRADALNTAVKNAADSADKHLILLLGKGGEALNRGCGCDELCEPDEKTARKAIENYNSRISLNAALSGAESDELVTVCIDDDAVSSELIELGGINRKAVAVCSKKAASKLASDCFAKGIAVLVIEEEGMNEAKPNTQKKVSSSLKIGILPIFVAVLPKEYAVKVARSLKSESLVYITSGRGILFCGNSVTQKLSYRRAVLINKAFPDMELESACFALRAGIKKVAFVDKERLTKGFSDEAISYTAVCER